MSWDLFLPVILAGIAYGIISVVAGVISSRGDADRAERVRDYGFVVLLAIGAWTVILLIISIFNRPNSVSDMVVITLVIVVFFALLLVVFFGISLLFGALGRMTSRRRQVTTEDL
jgi:Kef-type K+ transport system membrane component KefB